jgi:amidase
VGRVTGAADLTGVAATALAAIVARRRASAEEVVAAHLARIAESDGRLNAVVALDAERALAQARAADAALARGEAPGPLHGVPFTVKDNFEAAGLPMAIGVPERARTVPDADATAVARLREAGAILLGKTNCPPWGGGIETDNPVYGRTNNPYDLERTPGGSSGGEAAIIAAGGSACGLGTDSGASARLPAHFCGLAAIKPTAGRVPITGVIDDEGRLGALSDPRTQVSPMARTVADVALLLRIVAGPDSTDGGVAPVALGDPGAIDVGALHVAVHTDNGLAEPTRETVVAVRDAAAALRVAGAHVEEARPPDGGHDLTIEIWRSYDGAMSSLDLYRVLRRWDAYRAEMLTFADPYDLILCPVFPSPARRHGAMLVPAEVDPTSYTTPANLTGWPAATVRAGTSPEGLPIGVQLVARPWRDDVALAAALHLERELGGFRAPAAPVAPPASAVAGESGAPGPPAPGPAAAR